MDKSFGSGHYTLMSSTSWPVVSYRIRASRNPYQRQDAQRENAHALAYADAVLDAMPGHVEASFRALCLT